MCCNVSGQSWMNSTELAEENVRASLLKKLLYLSVVNCCNGHWSRKNYFNHCLIGWNSFQRLQIDVQLKPKKASFKQRCHVRIWSKWRHIFSLFWWSGTFRHRKWSERTYLRDKQFKRNIQVMVKEIAPWNLSDAWRRNRITTTTWTRTAILLIFTDRIENLRSEAQLRAGKKIFNVCQFKLSS